MKKFIPFVLISFLFSCSSSSNKNEEILKLQNISSELQTKQQEQIKRGRDELDRMSAYILNMANAGASKNVLDSLDNEKKLMTEENTKKLKDIEIMMDNNFKTMDSIIKSK